MHLIKVSTCQLNQWALDWEGNLKRIVESIRTAKSHGSRLRVGPELEITGYGCLDHFLEADTFLHSLEMVARILADESLYGILIDVGAPVQHRNVRYNCRIVILDGKILLIRPKLWLANEGNYREMRYFTAWSRPTHVEEYYLPRIIQDITGQAKVPIGDAVLSTLDTCIGAETCEELFTPNAPHIPMSLNGVEIFLNSSGSHHELRKLDKRFALILEGTRKAGGIYLYSNFRGGDGDRLYYDGSAMIIVNGEIVAQGPQFGFEDVSVITATVDVQEVRSYRSAPSRGEQAIRNKEEYKRIETSFTLSAERGTLNPSLGRSPEIQPTYHSPAAEIAYGPSCWLWDYLRRSNQAGFFLPLSGGIDSCSTAVIVFSMCRQVVAACKEGNEQVISDVRKICGEPEGSTYIPMKPQELCGRIFHTAYMGSVNSSKETRKRAKDLANDIGSYHTDLNIDTVTDALVSLFSKTTNFVLKFRVHGGSAISNLALQNIQARVRMVTAYMFAQTLPLVRGRTAPGSLLVLGSANVDEALRGYYTKYDCSAADINPIGGCSKTDLKSFIEWSATEMDLPILKEFIAATPSAELEPMTEDYVQSDEIDMGMTYEELSVFGRLRKVHKLGPYGMWQRLSHEWYIARGLSPRDVYVKVRRFFWFYAINRHKMTTLTPSVHMEAYSPDDNRFDLRPFLYPVFSWPWKKIESELDAYESGQAMEGAVEERKTK